MPRACADILSDQNPLSAGAEKNPIGLVPVAYCFRNLALSCTSLLKRPKHIHQLTHVSRSRNR